MLKIDEIRIDNRSGWCLTDKSPQYSLRRESNVCGMQNEKPLRIDSRKVANKER